ncbi:VanZ family protein [Candidatus Methylomirabilis limnetica]|nr:VanZ family protein [Candidatus Methylomirabilis limnetica]
MRQTIKILRYMPLLFCICLALVSLLALIPSTSIPKAFQFWDKAQHALAYSILSIMGCFAFPQRLRPVFFGLITHGVIIEVMQGALTSTRFGDPLDLLADGIGVLIGVIVYAFLSPKLTGTLQYSH